MGNLERPLLGDQNSFYVDIQDNQISGNKNSQTQNIAALIGPNSFDNLIQLLPYRSLYFEMSMFYSITESIV